MPDEQPPTAVAITVRGKPRFDRRDHSHPVGAGDAPEERPEPGADLLGSRVAGEDRASGLGIDIAGADLATFQRRRKARESGRGERRAERASSIDRRTAGLAAGQAARMPSATPTGSRPRRPRRRSIASSTPIGCASRPRRITVASAEGSR